MFIRKPASLFVVTALGMAAQAQIILIDNHPSLPDIAGNQPGGPFVLASVFEASLPLTVDGIGAFDNGKNGFAASLTVGLFEYKDHGASQTWDVVPGTSVTFSGASGSLGAGSNFRVVDIANVSISPGRYAIVAANYGESTEQNYNSQTEGVFSTRLTFNAAPGTTLNNGWYDFGGTLSASYDDSLISHGPFPGGLEPVFGAGTITVVPEPVLGSSCLALGMMGFLFVRRKRFARS